MSATTDAGRDAATDAPRALDARTDSRTGDAPVALDVPQAPIDVPVVRDVPPPPRDVPAPPRDVPPPPPDVPSVPGACNMGAPLVLPIAGCMPATPPSTGDPHEDCVRRINQFRCECQHLPPLMRWRDGEACADMMAEYDSMHVGMPHAAFRAGICSGGSAQNECPGWPSVPATVSGCLQQMWDEGPGDFYGPPAHGHYINMSTHSQVACGFSMGAGGVYAAQNFQ